MSTLLPIRICSPRKSAIKTGFLRDIYTDHMLQAFFRAFDRHGYAVLSRKLGICLSSEMHENYGDWEEKGDEQILAMLREQARNPALSEITFIYWNHRPLTHAKWVTMLRSAGFRVIERRTLAEIESMLHATTLPRHVAQHASQRAILDTWMQQPATRGAHDKGDVGT